MMRKRNIAKNIFWACAAFLSALPMVVFGQTGRGSNRGSGTGSNGGTGSGNVPRIENPLSVDSIVDFLDKLLAQVVKYSIPVIVLFIIWAGFQFVTAQGNPDKIKDAKKTLQYTLIGAAIILGARLLAAIIAGTITGIGN